MNPIYSLIIFLVLSCRVFSQTSTFHNDIAPIIYQKCAPCHSPGSIGPFPLSNYDEVKMNARMIEEVTSTGYMPPWRADISYQSFSNQITLSDDEVDKISAWVKAGAPEGDKSSATEWKKPGEDSKSSQSAVFCMEQAYTLKGNQDVYREFVLPTAFSEDKYVKAVRFKPGNTRVVHHAWVFFDESGAAKRFDAADQEYGYDAFSRMGAGDFKKMPGFLPGMRDYTYPESTGVILRKGADIVIQIHYAPSAKAEPDSSCVEILFSDNISREVQFLEINETHLSTIGMEDLQRLSTGDFSVLGEHLSIPAGEKRTFTEKYGVLEDMSLISIIPHMHYRGKLLTCYAVTSAGDTIRLIKTKNWDFDWQSAYIFKKLIHIPEGSVIYATGEFDNTFENPSNPVSPPADAKFGFGSRDEMLEVSIEYLLYQQGDENVSLEKSSIMKR
jgi:hypothetical protein